ncbi:MAG TPA: FAD-dependent tricarballylate dehydrogenase TcuA [Candidatus Binatia bacterium]|nr:FAD-dependent tricarballylate dehydrogenase TcuA [Candidatus Binatia bacterium]
MSDVDVVVCGGGNAALCAAIQARRNGATVTLLEAAPVHLRGGNTRHTRDIRFAHYGPNAAATETYSEQELLDDLLRVTEGETNRPLAELTVRESLTLAQWMQQQGVRWQRPLRGTLQLGRTNGFFLGGGKHLVNTYYETAIRLGVRVEYEAAVRAIECDGTAVRSVVYDRDGAEYRVRCRAAIVAAGGFEADVEWLKEYWGPAAEHFLIRGTPYNKGIALKAMFAVGARQTGDPRGLHCIAVDARAPKFDGGIVTRIDAIPFGIAVNRLGERFYDEGEDLWPKRYAIWGNLIAQQPGQTAFAIFDAKVMGHFIPAVYRPLCAPTMHELACLLELEPARLVTTVDAFNASVAPGGAVQLGVLDDCTTRGLTPPKTHWAQRIDTAPYYAYPLRPGVTFTYLGVEVDADARVIRHDGDAFENLFAAGECMSGNILSRGYLAGFGLTIGSVFGRIAGTRAAARYVRA